MQTKNSKRNILILTTSIGSGHVKVAQVLKKSFEQNELTDGVQVVDVFELLPGWFRSSFMAVYLWLIHRFPQIYGTVYAWGDRYPFLLRGRSVIGSFLAGKLAARFLQEHPDAVICTHATPAGIMSRLVQQGRYTGRLYGVVTDFAVHRWWIYPQVHRYFVAVDEMKSDFVRAGYDLQNILETGIPVQEPYSGGLSQDRLRSNIGLVFDKPVVLLMGGGDGLLPVEELLLRFSNEQAPIQCIVVAGKNAALEERIRKKAAELQMCVRVYGYVDCIPELMAASTVLVTKPGGVTCAEALAHGLPTILFSPLPGVEEKNALLLSRKFDAYLAVEMKDVSVLLSQVLDKIATTSAAPSPLRAVDKVVAQVMLDLEGV